MPTKATTVGRQRLTLASEAPAAGEKFIVGEFIGTGGGAFDDVGDAEFEVEKQGFLEGGEEARREAAAVEGRPEAIAGAAEVVADGGSVEAGVDAGEKDDEVFGGEIRDKLVVRGEELGFGGFPRSGQCPIHRAASWEGIFLAVRRLRLDNFRRNMLLTLGDKSFANHSLRRPTPARPAGRSPSCSEQGSHSARPTSG